MSVRYSNGYENGPVHVRVDALRNYDSIWEFLELVT